MAVFGVGMALSARSPAGGFLGSFQHGLDASFRVMVPVEWRAGAQGVVFTLLPWPLGQAAYLLVLPPARWARLLEGLRSLSLSNEDAAVVERAIAGEAVRVKLDKVGRLALSESLAARMGFGREVRLVGRFDKFEVWDPERFESAGTGSPGVLAQTAKSLHI